MATETAITYSLNHFARNNFGITVQEHIQALAHENEGNLQLIDCQYVHYKFGCHTIIIIVVYIYDFSQAFCGMYLLSKTSVLTKC